MNPVDDFLKSAGILDNLKGAFESGVSGGAGTSFLRGRTRMPLSSTIAQGMGQAIPGALVGLGMAAGAAGVSKAYDVIKERLSKPRDYKAMLAANPTVGKYDAGQVQMVYNSLRSQAPSLAKDPFIANSFIRKTLELATDEGPYIDPQTVKTLAEAQRNISQAKSERGKGGLKGSFAPTMINPIDTLPFRQKEPWMETKRP